MGFFPKPSAPKAALRDGLDFFLEARPHKGLIVLASLLLPALIMLAVNKQFSAERQYRPPEVIFVQQWSENRTVADIKAQQARDLPGELAAKAAAEDEARRRREAFKSVQARMKQIGID